MPEVIQLIYASKATFKSNADTVIDREVARILMESRRNNSKRNIGGVLYYGDGNFFQCLEGEATVVEKIFEKIKNDPRHSQVQVLMQRNVITRNFSSWSMKYVPVQEDVHRILKQNGFSAFDPYKFNVAMIEQMIGILSNAEDPTRGSSLLKEAGLISLIRSFSTLWQIVFGITMIGLITAGTWIFL